MYYFYVNIIFGLSASEKFSNTSSGLHGDTTKGPRNRRKLKMAASNLTVELANETKAN